MKKNLSYEEYIEVEPNDIVGACMQNDFFVSPLYLVGISSTTSQSLYIWDQDSTRYCGTNRVHYSHLVTQNNSILHVYADVGKSQFYELCGYTSSYFNY